MCRVPSAVALAMTAALVASCRQLPAAPSAGSPPLSDLALVPAPGLDKLVIDIPDSCGIPAPTNSRSYDVEVGELGRTGSASVETGISIEGAVWPSGRFVWNNFADVCDFPDAGNPPVYLCGEGHVSMTETGFTGDIGGWAWVGSYLNLSCRQDARHHVTLTRR